MAHLFQTSCCILLENPVSHVVLLLQGPGREQTHLRPFAAGESPVFFPTWGDPDKIFTSIHGFGTKKTLGLTIVGRSW